MRFLFDVPMVIIASVIMWKSMLFVTHQKSKSLADYAILLLYVFNCIPVLCDIIFGIPDYNTSCAGFKQAQDNDLVCIIYDLYILLLFLALYRVSKVSNIKWENRAEYDVSIDLQKIPSMGLFALIIAPFVHLILSGNIGLVLIYGSYNDRGLPSGFTKTSGLLVIVSILAFCLWLFKQKIDVKRWIIFFIYGVLISWLNGKRYVVITVVYAFFYMYTTTKKNYKRKGVLPLLVIVGILTVVYAGYYLINIRGIANNAAELYTSLRIDLGRDDVVKYTILEEYINDNHILDYPMQTILSTLFMLIPRTIYPTKAYPHYVYLTASLYGTTVENIPSGMTPSILEMMIANFRWFGMPICILFLCQFCKWADNSNNYSKKFCFAILLMGMLSQSLDAMLVVFYLVLFFIITRRVKFVFKR